MDGRRSKLWLQGSPVSVLPHQHSRTDQIVARLLNVVGNSPHFGDTVGGMLACKQQEVTRRHGDNDATIDDLLLLFPDLVQQ